VVSGCPACEIMTNSDIIQKAQGWNRRKWGRRVNVNVGNETDEASVVVRVAAEQWC
jgi:hypothetical protein